MNWILTNLYERFPMLAWHLLCQIAYQRATTGTSRQTIHLPPVLDGVVILSRNGPVQPIKMYAVMRVLPDEKAEIAETGEGWLKVTGSDEMASRESLRLGVAWQSQELWCDTPNPYEPFLPTEAPATSARAFLNPNRTEQPL